jgi:hypothetical protein
MSPIIELLKKSKVFEWIEKCQNAWEEIKKLLCTSPYFDQFQLGI